MEPTAPPDEELAQPPVSKTAYVLERMRREIASGAIQPGGSLRQTDLAARYGVSPTPVREALRLLEAEGSISYSPNRGATVAEMDGPRLRDLYLLRATVESLATRVAVQRISNDAQVKRIKKLHRELADRRFEVDAAERSRMNRALHFAIYSCGSPTIAEHIHSLWRLLPTSATIWDTDKVAETLVTQHGNIIEAIADRDAGAAAAFMYEHVMTAGRIREDLANG
jgi:DNA-binding GntR family transcriptional regulator